MTEPGCSFREMYDQSVGSLGAQGPQIAAEVSSIAALASCVALGMGCALMPELAVSARQRAGDVAVAYLDDAGYHTPLTMTWHRRWETRPSVAAFLDIARGTLARRA